MTLTYRHNADTEIVCTVVTKRQVGPLHTVYLCERQTDGFRFAGIVHAANPQSVVLWHVSYADGGDDYVKAIRPRGEKYLRRPIVALDA